MIIDAIMELFIAALPARRRGRDPWMSGPSAIVAGLIGGAAGLLLYRSMLEEGWVTLVAWALIPFMATYIVLTVLGRGDAAKGGLAAAGMALAVALPFALLDMMFSPWSGG